MMTQRLLSLLLVLAFSQSAFAQQAPQSNDPSMNPYYSAQDEETLEDLRPLQAEIREHAGVDDVYTEQNRLVELSALAVETEIALQNCRTQQAENMRREVERSLQNTRQRRNYLWEIYDRARRWEAVLGRYAARRAAVIRQNLNTSFRDELEREINRSVPNAGDGTTLVWQVLYRARERVREDQEWIEDMERLFEELHNFDRDRNEMLEGVTNLESLLRIYDELIHTQQGTLNYIDQRLQENRQTCNQPTQITSAIECRQAKRELQPGDIFMRATQPSATPEEMQQDIQGKLEYNRTHPVQPDEPKPIP